MWKLYRIPRIGVVVFFTVFMLSILGRAVRASDIIPYRQLTEADFTSPDTPPANEDAQAATGIDVNIGGQTIKTEKQSDGTYKSSFSDWTYRAVLDKSQSTWKKKDSSGKNIPDPDLLKHEQGHFDKAQILANKLNAEKKKALAEVYGTGATPEDARKDLTAKYKAYVEKVNQDESDIQQQYDDDTEHGKDKDKQKGQDRQNAASLTSGSARSSSQARSTSDHSIHYNAATKTLTFTDDTITKIENQDGTDAGPDALIGSAVNLPAFVLQGYTVGGAAFFVPVADDQFSIANSATTYLTGQVPFIFYFNNQFLANPPDMSALDLSSAFIGGLQAQFDYGDTFTLGIQIFPNADFGALTGNFTRDGVSAFTNLIGAVTPVPEMPGSAIVAAGIACLAVAVRWRSRRFISRAAELDKQTNCLVQQPGCHLR